MWFIAVTPPILDHSSRFDFTTLVELGLSLLSAPYFLFWVWMLLHCIRTEPDRRFWIWILIIVQPIGTVAYFLLRYLPSVEFPQPEFVRRWARGRELTRLEVAAIQIGNPHQFVQWGNALREVGYLDRAREAYAQALQKDPRNIQALWGSALVAQAQKRFADVVPLAQQVLEQDPQYKFGDVSLALGRAFKELGQDDAAREQFERHVRRWRHPEALLLLAELYEKHGDTQQARNTYQSLIYDVSASPLAIARKHGRWKSRARNALRKLV